MRQRSAEVLCTLTMKSELADDVIRLTDRHRASMYST